MVPILPSGPRASYIQPSSRSASDKMRSASRRNSSGAGGLQSVWPTKLPSVPISRSSARRGPHRMFNPNFFACSRIASVGFAQSTAAIPVVPLPAKPSNTVSPGFVCEAMNSAIASGEILVGYGNAENRDPLRDALSGSLYKVDRFFSSRLRERETAPRIAPRPLARVFALFFSAPPELLI